MTEFLIAVGVVIFIALVAYLLHLLLSRTTMDGAVRWTLIALVVIFLLFIANRTIGFF